MSELTQTEKQRIEKALDKRKKEKAKTRPQTQYEVIYSLVPTIEQYQADGLTIDEVREALTEAVPTFNIKPTTFKQLLQKAKRDFHGVSALPRGRPGKIEPED